MGPCPRPRFSPAGPEVEVISRFNVSIYPRWESLVPATVAAWEPGRASFGIADLDPLIGGGLNVGTTTLIAGSHRDGPRCVGHGEAIRASTVESAIEAAYKDLIGARSRCCDAVNHCGRQAGRVGE